MSQKRAQSRSQTPSRAGAIGLSSPVVARPMFLELGGGDTAWDFGTGGKRVQVEADPGNWYKVPVSAQPESLMLSAGPPQRPACSGSALMETAWLAEVKSLFLESG